MAVSPVKVSLKDRLKNGWTGFNWTGGGREFYPGGTDAQRRFSRAQLAQDIADMMNQNRHRMLLGDARYIYQSSSSVSGMVDQKARYVYGRAWRLQSHSADPEFVKAVEEDFVKIDTLLDMRGTDYSFRRNIKIGSMTLDRDGDYFIILTEDPETGFPKLQYLEAHKVGDWGKVENGIIKEGKYKDFRSYTGVIVNEFARPVAFRIKDGSKKLGYQDMPASGAQYVFDEQWYSQGRGTPTIAKGILDWYDLAETKDAQKIKQKVNSALTLIESTESGKTDFSKLTGAAPASRSGVTTQLLESGMLRIIKNGGSLTGHTSKDPPKEWLDYFNSVETAAFYANGWRREMLDSSKIGGAGVRAIVADVNKSIFDRVDVLRAAQMRCALFIISKRAKMGTYKLPADWFKISFTLPAEFTVDEGRMRKADLEDLRVGVTTETKIASAKGHDFEETIRQRAKELKFRMKIEEDEGLPPGSLGTLAMPGDPDGADGDEGIDDDPEDKDFLTLKAEFDAYGVAVRAGSITPQRSDEDSFRKDAGWPDVSDAVDGAWKADKGFRRPITLQSGEEALAASQQASEED